MKDETVNGLADLVANRTHTNRLSGCKTDNSPFLIVVRLTAILNIASLCQLQKQCVNAIMHLYLIDRPRRFRKVDNAYQRVQCFKSVQIVVLVHIIQIYNLFHNPKYLNSSKDMNYFFRIIRCL